VLRITRATICTVPAPLTCGEVPTWKGFSLVLLYLQLQPLYFDIRSLSAQEPDNNKQESSHHNMASCGAEQDCLWSELLLYMISLCRYKEIMTCCGSRLLLGIGYGSRYSSFQVFSMLWTISFGRPIHLIAMIEVRVIRRLWSSRRSGMQ